jgi:peptidyl-prolyl cis-trans isomerase B (cyclophilin B)
VVEDSNFLDGKYTAFGKVLSGMSVADTIVNVPRDPKDNPNKRVEMKVKITNR